MGMVSNKPLIGTDKASRWLDRQREETFTQRIVDSPDIRCEHSSKGVALFLSQRQGGGGGRIEQFVTAAAPEDEFIQCKSWNGKTSGSDIVYVARAPEFRVSHYDNLIQVLPVATANTSNVVTTSYQHWFYESITPTLRRAHNLTEIVANNTRAATPTRTASFDDWRLTSDGIQAFEPLFYKPNSPGNETPGTELQRIIEYHRPPYLISQDNITDMGSIIYALRVSGLTVPNRNPDPEHPELNWLPLTTEGINDDNEPEGDPITLLELNLAGRAWAI
jgi:hypothetical protein